MANGRSELGQGKTQPHMRPVTRLRAVLLLVVFCVGGTVGLAKDFNAGSVAARLDALKDIIATDTTSILRTNTFTTSYTTVWAAI